MAGKEDEVLYPLEHEWILWEHEAGPKDPNRWKDSMKQLCSFKAIGDFWRYFNHVPKPADIFFDGDSKKRVGAEGKVIGEYSLFKRGIEPEWGDPSNRTGGEWHCRQSMQDGADLNMYWQNLVLGVIGEVIENECSNGSGQSYINGARVVDKGRNQFATFRLELWISTKDIEIREKIRAKLVELVTDGFQGKKGQLTFEWKDHS